MIDQGQESVRGDIVDLLHERHEQIREAFAGVVAAEGPVKAALVDELVTILAVHEAVTQELIRPLVQRQGPLGSTAGTGPQGEPAEDLACLARLSSMDVDDDDFEIELLGVARTVALHIEAQECDDLPLLRSSIPTGELFDLAEVLLSAEAVARASASAIRAEIASPDAVGPLDVLAALGGARYWDQRRTSTAEPTLKATTVAAAAHPRRRHGIRVLAAWARAVSTRGAACGARSGGTSWPERP